MHLYEQLQANIKILREHQQRISQERSKMISQGWTIDGFNRTPRQQQRWNWRSSWRHQVPMNVHSLSIESYISIPWKAGVRGRSPYFKTGIKDWSLQEINSLLEDETKNEPFGHSNQHYVWRKKSEAFNPNTTITAMKHLGGSIMLQGCFAGKGTGALQKYSLNLSQSTDEMLYDLDGWHQVFFLPTLCQDAHQTVTSESTQLLLVWRNVFVVCFEWRWESKS